MKHHSRYELLLFLFSMVFSCVNSQSEKKQASVKDSLDGKFDLSDYIINENGFVPIPYIITEPALGGFGGALFPVFIKKASGVPRFNQRQAAVNANSTRRNGWRCHLYRKQDLGSIWLAQRNRHQASH